MNERLKFLLKTTGKRQVDFAKFLAKLNNDNYRKWESYVSGLVTGRDSMGFSAIDKILKFYPNLNLNWFITGKGEMFTTEDDLRIVAEDSASYGTQKNIIDLLKNELNIKTQEIAKLMEIINKSS